MWRLTCKMPIPSLFLSFNDVQATILVWSSYFLDSRCIMALGLWQNFFVKIESAVFVCCHGNHPVFCVNYVFERCTGHNTDPIVLINQTLFLLFECLMTGQWSKFEWLHHDVFEPKLLWNNGVVLLTESWLITSILRYVFYCLYVSKCHLDVLISKIMIPSKCM